MGRKKRHTSSKLLAPLQPDRHQQFEMAKARARRHSPRNGYGSLVRRTIFFQFRLAADGIRDLLLSPISVIAALLGILRPDNPSWALDRLMMVGRRTDRWINLFEQEDQLHHQQRGQTMDDLFDQMEREVKTRMDPNVPEDEASWAGAFSNIAGNRDANR